MMQALPPTCDAGRLEAELGLVPHADREEAVQEAWLAHLSGRSPARAARTFARRERRHRRRETAASLS
jgi:hypothetical protein